VRTQGAHVVVRNVELHQSEQVMQACEEVCHISSLGELGDLGE
jgi:hypothetical protein